MFPLFGHEPSGFFSYQHIPIGLSIGRPETGSQPWPPYLRVDRDERRREKCGMNVKTFSVHDPNHTEISVGVQAERGCRAVKSGEYERFGR